MPFEVGAVAPKKIAVIGAGISGMGAAHMLADQHRVTLFEAEPRLGGHARTVMAGKNGDRPVDTGFIVFNYATYPHLTALFDRLDVPVKKSRMSFGASFRGGAFEYALNNLNSLFCQRTNMVDPRYWRMIRDILKFNAQAEALATDPDLTLRDFLTRLGTGDWFRDRYLLPFSGAIWSTPPDRIMDFPAKTLVQFFRNHGLLGVFGQHQWYTVDGGSIEYVRRLEAAMRAQGVELRLGTPIAGVRRSVFGVEVRARHGEWELFDEVVFATHSDDSLSMLTDASPDERRDLGAIAYQPNDIVLHRDATLMPRRKACWASWTYAEGPEGPSDRIDLSYWMNSLQSIPEDDPHFITLNTTREIRQELIYDQVTLRHPVYDRAALAAQERVRVRNGNNNTWFCGAWMRYGFHEDGLDSAVQVAEAINTRDALAVAAE